MYIYTYIHIIIQWVLPPQKSVTSANSSDLNRLENVIAKFDE